MKNLTFTHWISAVACMLLISCRYSEVKGEFPEINRFKIGEKFRITLPEDHLKGETWQIKKDENYRAFEDLGSVWHGQAKGVDFNLKALSSGQYTLEFSKTVYQERQEMKQYIVNIKAE